MGIEDHGTGGNALTINHAALNSSWVPCTGALDLNAEFGTGPTAVAAETRRAPLISQTQGLMLRLDIAATFVAGAGTPRAIFHAVVSDSPLLTPPFETAIIGSSTGPLNDLTSPNFQVGWTVDELVAGKSLFISLNPWTDLMGRTLAVPGSRTPLVGKNLRYLGIASNTVNWNVTTSFFSIGGVTMTLVRQADIGWNPSDFIYPTSYRNV